MIFKLNSIFFSLAFEKMISIKVYFEVLRYIIVVKVFM